MNKFEYLKNMGIFASQKYYKSKEGPIILSITSAKVNPLPGVSRRQGLGVHNNSSVSQESRGNRGKKNKDEKLAQTAFFPIQFSLTKFKNQSSMKKHNINFNKQL